jgi:excinuclease UvrABC nuclease subunit
MALNEVAVSLAREGWQSPNAYSKSFADLPRASGIYLFLVYPDFNASAQPGIVGYVGKSINIKQRMTGHEMATQIRADLPEAYVQRWFKKVPKAELEAAEIQAIRRFDPPYNIQYRRRGINVAA